MTSATGAVSVFMAAVRRNGKCQPACLCVCREKQEQSKREQHTAPGPKRKWLRRVPFCGFFLRGRRGGSRDGTAQSVMKISVSNLPLIKERGSRLDHPVTAKSWSFSGCAPLFCVSSAGATAIEYGLDRRRHRVGNHRCGQQHRHKTQYHFHNHSDTAALRWSGHTLWVCSPKSALGLGHSILSDADPHEFLNASKRMMRC